MIVIINNSKRVVWCATLGKFENEIPQKFQHIRERKKDDIDPSANGEDFRLDFPLLLHPGTIFNTSCRREEEEEQQQQQREEKHDFFVIVVVVFFFFFVRVRNEPFEEKRGEVYIYRLLLLDILGGDNHRVSTVRTIHPMALFIVLRGVRAAVYSVPDLETVRGG